MVVLIAGEIVHMWPAAVYLIAAYGLGRLATPLWRDTRDPSACQLASGLAIMLTLSHLMGIAGLLSAAPALAVCAIGVALSVRQVIGPAAGSRRRATPANTGTWMWLGALPALAVVIAAVSVPPGVLWGSEFGGYDVLSYHLALPQEWIAAGRVWPVEHNVYSYLPGYVESAFAHVALLSFAPQHEAFVSQGGWRLTSAQGLHAGLWAISAWLVARAGTAWLVRTGCDERAAHAGGIVGGVLVAATPWTVVVGSMAYNEMGAIALGAGALLIAAEASISPIKRGVLVGMLLGVAAGVKPSAALMMAPMIGISLLGLSERKQWKAIVLGGLIAGLLAVSPWMVRNMLATGSPVFPFATGFFGTGHWSAEQAARWASAHHGSGSLMDHLGLLFGADANAATNAPDVVRHRGMSNPQWGLMFWVMGCSLMLSVLLKKVRVLGVVLVLGAAMGLGVWLIFTHHQSRFLLSMVLPAGLALSLACGEIASRTSMGGVGRIALGLGAVIGLAQSALTWKGWSGEARGTPASLLGQGSMFFTGELFAPDDRAEIPIGFVRMYEQELGGKLYLLGESTPLYWPGDTVYHTTWDDGPTSRAVRTAPDDPDAWIAALQDAGIGAVMVNRSELARLGASGWLGPELSAANVAELIARCEVVRSWPGYSQTLLKVPPANRTEGRP